MRIYLPATFSLLKQCAEDGEFPAQGGWAFAVTDGLRDFFDSGEEEEIAMVAFDSAALASLRLLTVGDSELPHRRVVISADVPDASCTPDPEMGEPVVKLDPAVIDVRDFAAIHMDVADAEEATAKAITLIDAADLGDEDAELAVGDAQDNLMAYYDANELNALVQLSN
ncbi:DUF6912 family protein [Corynebacterium propinquum]|uniref:DUF6912 family protein n=1 Tax=Corynebacterium propinquum TaxID=43769 RepID=UPI000665B0B9|nr:hypothetical protein [Corynebacterium propinquum]MCG7232521.1 hypothetical protein [Corynebacterium propinquum]MDK4234626.1 hypothetical protein [Corynebacterium propinquum]MDK4238693.1 hypothetical protein [Corynebacterium propinquum]MDK4301871.1 hypothetical protein [Corynebacterium propinquum]MDK4313187.1 hypothetical protein [Corynebacterium propinquum]